MEEILASIRRIIADDQGAEQSQADPSAADEDPELAAFSSDAADDVEAGPSEPLELEPSIATAPAVERAPETRSTPVASAPAPDLDIDLDELAFGEPFVPPALPDPFRAEAVRRSDSLRTLVAEVKGPAPEPEPAPSAPIEALISSEVTASVGQAFNMLSHTVLTRNARTLEDLVQDLLKPMLKTWLDDNLPPLVERLVRAEIERVVRGR